MSNPTRSTDSDRGAASVEYALLVTAIAAAIVIIIGALGVLAKSMFSDTCDTIKTADSSTAQTC